MREMKDSGIEWVGKVPATWKIMPNKYIMTKKKVIKEVYDGENIISLSMNGVIIRDLERPISYGDECDKECWMQLLKILKMEVKENV